MIQLFVGCYLALFFLFCGLYFAAKDHRVIASVAFGIGFEIGAIVYFSLRPGPLLTHLAVQAAGVCVVLGPLMTTGCIRAIAATGYEE